jgi:hypothetical protein
MTQNEGLRTVEVTNMNDLKVSADAKAIQRLTAKFTKGLHDLLQPSMEPLFAAEYPKVGIARVIVADTSKADMAPGDGGFPLLVLDYVKGLHLGSARVITPRMVLDVDEIRAGIVDLDKVMWQMAVKMCEEMGKAAIDGTLYMSDHYIPTLYIKQEAYMVEMFMYAHIFRREA